MNFRVVRLAAVVCLVVISGRAFANGGAVVVQDVPGYNSWPMIQSVGDDRLVCVYSRGKVHEIDEGGRGAYARVSSDGGRTWSAEVCVANDPVFCEVPIGKGRSRDGGAYFWIRCYGGSNPRHDLYKTMDGIRFSRVATPSFSPLPMQITDIFSVGSELVALWFAGDYSDKPVHSWGMLVSDDDGKSWRQRTVEQGLFQKDWPTEPSVANLGNGRLLAIARTECDGPQFQLTSQDAGKTWQKVRTNISDVRASTPSLLYDPTTGLVANYYYERGKGNLRRRVAVAADICERPLSWPDSEIVANGSSSLWDAGNVNAIAVGAVHHLAYYSGAGADTRVLVFSLPAPGVDTLPHAASGYSLDRGVMAEDYWKNWSEAEDRRMDADIDMFRKSDAVFRLAAPPGTTVTVEQISHAFYFGAHIFNFNQLGTCARNRRYRDLYGTLFNSATVGFYWNEFEPEPGRCRFAPEAEDEESFWNAQVDPAKWRHWRRPATDLPIDWCLRRGVRVHGHPLVWNAANAVPMWLYGRYLPAEEKTALDFPDFPDEARGDTFRTWYNTRYKPWYERFRKTHTERDFARMAPVFAANLKGLQEMRIRAIAARYRNRVKSWDVVNESCDEIDYAKGVVSGEPVTFGEHGVGGEDYVYSAFRTAMDSFPATVRLNINECNVNRVYTNEIVQLEKAGARIDVVGAQMHLFGTNALHEIAQHGGERDRGRWGSSYFWRVESPAQVRERIGMLARLGKPVHMSEITISAPGDDARARMQQAIVARNLYKAWFSCGSVCGITWWNVVDGCGYTGEPTTSGLFTRDMQPKDAFYALDGLVNGEWKTRTKVPVSTDGCVRFRGFKGGYKLTWRDSAGCRHVIYDEVR